MSRIESSLRCSAQIKSLPEFVRAEYVAAADRIAELEAERDALARALEDAEKVPALIRALQEICLRADCQSFSMGTDITAIAKKAIDAARKK